MAVFSGLAATVLPEAKNLLPAQCSGSLPGQQQVSLTDQVSGV